MHSNVLGFIMWKSAYFTVQINETPPVSRYHTIILVASEQSQV